MPDENGKHTPLEMKLLRVIELCALELASGSSHNERLDEMLAILEELKPKRV
jgi:hypothetical protein